MRQNNLTFLGVVRLGEDPDFVRFTGWLDQSHHAGMSFLENHQHLRRDPRGLGDGLRSAIIVGFNYYQGDTRAQLRQRGGPSVAQYARLRDYHRVIRDLGGRILSGLPGVLGHPVSGRVTTDSAPILERSHAARAGKGFVGKNTCFIQPGAGSFYLLGEILVDADLPVPEARPVNATERGADGGCGTCRRCQVHCPTGALDNAWNLDANKCLAYWSIEHRGLVPTAFWKWFSVYLFGCDICQLVCPYNRGAQPMQHKELLRVDAAPDLYQVATMTQAGYEAMFGGTPLTRAKREGLIRNALIAMFVTGHPRLADAMNMHKENPGTPEVIAGTIAQMDDLLLEHRIDRL